jgi:hypothetical protein
MTHRSSAGKSKPGRKNQNHTEKSLKRKIRERGRFAAAPLFFARGTGRDPLFAKGICFRKPAGSSARFSFLLYIERKGKKRLLFVGEKEGMSGLKTRQS